MQSPIPVNTQQLSGEARKMDELVGEVFDEVKVEEFCAPDLPKVMGYFYRGTAAKV